MNRVLTITTALCFVAGAAHAGGTHDPQPGAGTTYNTADMRQGQVQGQLQGQRQGQVANGGQGGAGGRGGAGGSTGPITINNGAGGGGYNYSARGNNPDVILGSVSGGNPCGLGAGAGGSGFSLGAILQMMWEGAGCQRNEDAKLLHNMGFDDATIKTRLCDGSKYRDAFAYGRSGPCATDPRIHEWEAAWRAQGYRPERGGWVR